MKEELVCESCTANYLVWYADDELWNAAVRLDDGTDRFEFLCPTCFCHLAAMREVETYFRLSRGEPKAFREPDRDIVWHPAGSGWRHCPECRAGALYVALDSDGSRWVNYWKCPDGHTWTTP